MTAPPAGVWIDMESTGEQIVLNCFHLAGHQGVSAVLYMTLHLSLTFSSLKLHDYFIINRGTEGS